MKNRFKLIVTATVFAFSYSAQAIENVGGRIATSQSQLKSVMASCAPAAAKEDLDINNVRATILTGGDMWWDLVNGKYLVPKPGAGLNGPTALFAGSLWIGGIDASNTLKVAGMTYRQTGNDFWPGPLSSLAVTDATICSTWDKFFKVNRNDVVLYRDWLLNGSSGSAPVEAGALDQIINWPSTGPEGQPMAPYYDANGNGVYDPYAGDYPDFWLGDGTRPAGQSACDAELFGDQVLFWVFNDKGNVHTESGGASIGLEIQAQAFAFQTNNEINNMTFYHYNIINKSSFRLDSTFFGVWADPDLGSASDDFVGCDVGLGLGYCYNGDLVDDNPPSGQIPYGVNPPAIGCDFFEGPYADPNGMDDLAASVPASFVNYGDSEIDNERLGMSKFVYYNNDASLTGNPSNATHFYGYLAGSWKDNTPITYGGTGHLTGISCDYMFPGSSDPSGFGTNGSVQAPWDEASVGNVPADRRFLQSAGPFTLQPGAVNTITTGLVWARATQGGNLASVTLMKGADAKAQELFNNCFAILRGPDAPNLAIQELENQLILTWTNPSTSNNYNENYSEDYDKSTGSDSLYRFQGYLVYQLKDETVTASDVYNVDKARLILQCDKIDNVKQIVNFTNDIGLQALVPQEMVAGADKGIVHSLSVTEDKFAVGTTTLVNHKTYYFAIIAYGYSPTLVTPDYAVPKDYLPFISSNKYADGEFGHSAIPHNPAPELSGTEQHSEYGTGPKLTRIEGHGNGGNVLDLTASTVSAILSSPTSRVINPTYENSRGPVTIKVVDPLSVPAGDFTFKLDVIPSIKYSNMTGPAFLPGQIIIDSLAAGDVAKATVIDDNGKIMHINTISTGLAGRPFGVGNTIQARYTTSFARVICYGPGGLTNATWSLASSSGTEYSDVTISSANEQIINGQPSGITGYNIPKWGLSVNVVQTTDPGTTTAVKNGFLEATMAFTDNTKQWLTGLTDEEGPTDANWIRAGAATFTPPENIYNDAAGTGVDLNQEYENMINKTWAPYRLCATYATATDPDGTVHYVYGGPAWPTNITLNKLANLASVDVIITNDKSQWTRCPVLEEQDDAVLAEGGAKKLHMRVHASVDKSGLANFPSTDNNDFATGMGWFPGYAINVETGERLNMAFGEDSWLVTENGRDMMWNPTGTKYLGGNPSFGGKHYIYVFGHNGDNTYPSTDTYLPNGPRDVPRYDNGVALHDMFAAVAIAAPPTVSDSYKREIFTDAMWVNIPLLAPGHSRFETSVKIRLRVAKSYQKGYTTSLATSADTSLTPVNRNMPMYTFNTDDIETHTNDEDAAKNALDLINIVPNPYYAYSAYERKALENIVKITNLPERCTISIYTLNGTLIRKFNKDDPKTSLDWDLKNQARIPVASGMYIIYINVPDVGEKTLKWFGVLRPIDLDSY